MRFHGSLEEIQASRTIRVRSHLLPVRSNAARHLVGTRNHVTQELQQYDEHTYPTGTYAEYREHTACNQARTDTGTHIILVKSPSQRISPSSIHRSQRQLPPRLVQLQSPYPFPRTGISSILRNSTFRFPTNTSSSLIHPPRVEIRVR